MIEFKAKVHMPETTAQMLQKLNLEEGGFVQKVIDATVIRYDMPYVPMETGTLMKSAATQTDIGSGEVIYPGPYAHYQYYGEVYGPNIPIFDDDSGVPTGWFSPPGQKKHPTGRELTYNTDLNPMAGSYWFERMKADHLDDIVEEARKAVGIRNSYKSP